MSSARMTEEDAADICGRVLAMSLSIFETASDVHLDLDSPIVAGVRATVDFLATLWMVDGELMYDAFDGTTCGREMREGPNVTLFRDLVFKRVSTEEAREATINNFGQTQSFYGS